MSTWSHFRPWICLSVEKIFRSFTAILLRFIKFVKRTWQYHFLANRLKQRWAHEETYHHMCGKHLLKSDARVVKSSPSLILRTFNINFICWLILSLHLRVPLQAIIFFGITFLQAILAKDIQHFRNISAVHCFALSDHTREK